MLADGNLYSSSDNALEAGERTQMNNLRFENNGDCGLTSGGSGVKISGEQRAVFAIAKRSSHKHKARLGSNLCHCVKASANSAFVATLDYSEVAW